MRTAPEHVLRALRQYHAELGLVWRRDRWFFTFRGEPLFAWSHDDGTPAINDLSADEALRIIKQADTSQDGPERLRKLFSAAASARARHEADEQQEFDAAAEEARDRARCFCRGPKSILA